MCSIGAECKAPHSYNYIMLFFSSDFQSTESDTG